MIERTVCRVYLVKGLKIRFPKHVPKQKKKFFIHLYIPHVEAGKSTSTVIPASRKMRQKGNPVVSDETVPADLREG
jgi:hypothetical protein